MPFQGVYVNRLYPQGVALGYVRHYPFGVQTFILVSPNGVAMLFRAFSALVDTMSVIAKGIMDFWISGFQEFRNSGIQKLRNLASLSHHIPRSCDG